MATRRSRRSSRHKHGHRQRHDNPAIDAPKLESHWSQRPARRPVPEAEKLLLSCLIVLIIILPWAIGTAHFWTQAAAALFAFICFIIALIPHDFSHDPTDSAAKRLVKFPAFWLGVAVLVFVGFQAFNPGYRVERADTVIWLNQIEATSFLPSGVSASIFEQGTARSLLVLLIPFFTICAMWTGITRRRSAYILLWVMVLNGVAIAGAAILQTYTRTKEVLWFFPPNEGESFISTFLHAPHAAAFFLVLTGPALGLGAHYYFQAKKTFERSNPSGLFAFTGIVFILMLLFSFQPIAAASAVFLMLLLLYFILHREFLRDLPMFQKVLFFGLGLVVMSVGASMAKNVAQAHVERRAPATHQPVAVVVEDPVAEDGEEGAAADGSDEGSEAADVAESSPAEEPEPTTTAEPEPVKPEPVIDEFAAGLQMFQDYWLFGAGAGSFAYLFPEYIDSPMPEGAENPNRILIGSDWVRIPTELGIIGSLLLAGIVLSLLAKIVHPRLRENPVPLFTVLGLLAVLLLAGTRVVFDNPAVLTTWLGLLTVSALVIRIETSRVVIEGKSGLSS